MEDWTQVSVNEGIPSYIEYECMQVGWKGGCSMRERSQIARRSTPGRLGQWRGRAGGLHSGAGVR